METTLNVVSVKLKHKGLKGAEVTYFKIEENRKRQFNNKISKDNKAPVPSEIKGNMKKLKYHLLSICGLWQASFNNYYDVENNEPKKNEVFLETDTLNIQSTMHDVLNRMDIVSVENNGQGIIIKGQIAIPGKSKKVKISTPVITFEDEYERYEDVVAITNIIFEAAALYNEGKLLVNAREYIVELYESQGKSKEEIEDFSVKMTDDDWEALMNEELGKNIISMKEMMGEEEDPEELLSIEEETTVVEAF